MDDFTIALIFGAIIIFVFAWDQFNRPSYERSRELTRLIELLTPAEMRKGTVYWRAYMFYAAILLLIYFTLCAYGALIFPAIGLEVPGLELTDEPQVGAGEIPVANADGGVTQTTGYLPPGESAGMQALSAEQSGEAGQEESGTSPMVPLIVSLTMVGLAPSVPILLRIEEKIRFAAHRLSGIPTRMVTGSRMLRQKTLDLAVGKDTYLIPPQEWERFKHYDEEAKKFLDDPAAFHEDYAKIMAFRSWVLNEKLRLSNYSARDNVAGIENDIGRKIERLIFDLDVLTGFEVSSDGSVPARGEEQTRAAWEKFATEADNICADICVLSMLYVEHGIVPTEEDGERFGWGIKPDESVPDITHQKYLAQRKLMRFVSDAARWADRDSISLVLWARATSAAVVVALVYGLFFGKSAVAAGEGVAPPSHIVIGLQYFLSALLTYALALLVAISYHQAAYQNNGWRDVFRDNWATWVPQLFAVFALSGLAAVTCHVALNIYATTIAVGWELVQEKFVPVLMGALQYEGPAAMRGPVLALMVILIADAWRCGEDGKRALKLLPPLTGLVMFAAGVLSRFLSSEVARAGWVAQGRGDEFQYDWALIFQTGLLAGLIGLAVGYFARATLIHEFPRRKTPRKVEEPQDDAAPLPQPAE